MIDITVRTEILMGSMELMVLTLVKKGHPQKIGDLSRAPCVHRCEKEKFSVICLLTKPLQIHQWRHFWTLSSNYDIKYIIQSLCTCIQPIWLHLSVWEETKNSITFLKSQNFTIYKSLKNPVALQPTTCSINITSFLVFFSL